jgi:nucleoid-associated protein YgaU
MENKWVVKFNGPVRRLSKQEPFWEPALTNRIERATICSGYGRGGNLNGQQIGIKLADGSFYPVLPEGERSRKKLVLTTVRDNQETVQIDLYRGEGQLAEEAEYIGTLMIENIHPAPTREPEVEVVLGLDEEGNLEATASDALSGESQSLSVSLASLSQGPAEHPEFELEREGAERDEFEESLLTGETYPLSAADRRKEHLHKKRRSPLLLIGFVLLSLILIAAIAFVVYRSVGGTPIPALLAGKEKTPAPEAAAAPLVESPEQAASRRPAEPTPTGGEGEQAAAASEPEQTSGGVWYEIKWGDTLWDIAATYYRNPWLYPKIARANKISNPDLIFAGTRLYIPEN